MGLQDPRDLKLGPSLPIPDKDALLAIAGLDWMCKDTSVMIRSISGLDSRVWRLSLERPMNRLCQ